MIVDAEVKYSIEKSEPPEHETYDAFEDIPETEIFEPLQDAEYEVTRY
jgi:hypothetical protein